MHSVLLLLVAIATVSRLGSCQASLPLYFGFFPNSNAEEQALKQLARDTLTEAFNIDEVRRQYCTYTNQSQDTPISNLTIFAYTNPTDELHVTSYYCNFGKQPDCARWAAQPAVQAAIGRAFAVNVTAFLLTPRTIGYRVELGPDALAIWGNTEGETVPGQRAHFTIATSPGVGAVQTGLDLLTVARKVGRPIGPRIVDFQEAQYLVLLSRPVPVVFKPSDSAGLGLRPTAWLTLLATAAWRLGKLGLSHIAG